VFAGLSLGSWALRPGSRRLRAEGPVVPVRIVEWAVPLAVGAVLWGAALLTLPKGPPPP
jgi:hypothetical protein